MFIRHLFIDEAQDYSPFQFALLKQMFPKSKWTLLGDFNQAIHAQALEAPLLSRPTETKEYTQINLTKSYRSTYEIVEFTKGMLTGAHEIEPFNRHGERPTLTLVEDVVELVTRISTETKQLFREGYQTVALICKTAKESQMAYELLKEQLEVELLDQEAQSFNKGLVILPAYLAKGIEFDSVLIYNAADTNYRKDIERNLFYTACTRAMHELHLFSLGKQTRFLEGVAKHTYVVK